MSHFDGKHFDQRTKEGGIIQELSCMTRPHVSRLCFLADALTYFRIIAALMILVATIMGYNADWVLAWFVVGELTDAFDGICARMFLYPRDGKRRFWREYASEIDQLADIFLGVAMLAYLMMRLSLFFGMLIFVIMLTIAIPVQVLRGWIGRTFGLKVREKIVLFRRSVYILAVVVVGMYTAFKTTFFRSLSNDWQLAIVFVTIVSLITLALFKQDRITEEKTAVMEPKLAHMKPWRRLHEPTPRGVIRHSRHKLVRIEDK